MQPLITVLAFLASSPTMQEPQGGRLPANAVWLDSLDLACMSQEWGSPHAARSVEGHPLRLRGKAFEHGVGTHANGEVTIALGGFAKRFVAMVGVDDEVGKHGSVAFEVWLDGAKAAATPVLRGSGEPQRLEVDLSGKKEMVLMVGDGGDGIDYDHADWADAMIVLADGAEPPHTMAPPDDMPMPIAPPSSSLAVGWPRVAGGSVGKPFLFRIPATGKGALAFGARGLPRGLRLEETSGILSGTLQDAGSSDVEVAVTNGDKAVRARIVIVAGTGKLARTPPLGWNSWNVWGTSVDDAKVRAAADALVASGLAAHGFRYVNIDDAWEGQRGADGRITSNAKFPDMKALADHVHGLGLCLGIYSSPGPKTCAGFEGSYHHEHDDAATWAEWGIDYVKYDWCSYGGIAKDQSQAEFEKPYVLMRDALAAAPRDIVYSLCQYGMGKVWLWGERVGANLWRTTGDITDTWASMSHLGFGQDSLEKSAGPGHWNDPDMLVVGELGWGPSIRPTRLTRNEQITHVTLWSLLAAPLLLGCDLGKLDDFTRALLMNDEVLAIDQDALGRQAHRVAAQGQLEVWARPLEDGTWAVGLFNRGRSKAAIAVAFADLGLSGEQPVRNLWTRTEERSGTSFHAEVARHGAVLIKVGAPQ